MNTLSIVHNNLKIRLLSTVLTIVSIAIGVTLVVTVSSIQKQTEENFVQTSVGYHLLLAAKGSQLQATLNALYHLETSVGVIPNSVYTDALRDPRVDLAIPLYVGDNYRGFRVIGTSPDFLLRGEPIKGRYFELAEGRVFDGMLEIVLGSEVAKRTGLTVGDSIYITHGLMEPVSGAEAHVHDELPVRVTGILEMSGTANDRALFAHYMTTAALHDVSYHNHVHDDNHDHADSDGHHDHARDSIAVKQIDALLIKLKNPASTIQISGMINYPSPSNPLLLNQMRRDPFFKYKENIMAVIPAMQVASLMGIIGNVERLFRIVALFVVIVALLGVLIGIYNTMEDRKRDIAILRVLGARKITVLQIILYEAGILSLTGGTLGLVGGHVLIHFLSPWIMQTAGIFVQPFLVDQTQLALIGVLIAGGILAGIIPAFKAYKTEAITHLNKI